MKAEIGTPCGSSQCGEIEGHWLAGEVKRELGCATGTSGSCSLGWPSQLIVPAGGSFSSGLMPGHQGGRAGVRPPLVKIEFFESVVMALGLVSRPVPGATPKKPFAGFTGPSRPPRPARNQ